jgi:DedD protein
MAFFKFRFPGQSASAAEAVTSGPSENIEVVRKRARHRLIGAVVLVLVAVVGFPLLFDTQPRPMSVDTPIVIPDRQATSPLTAPVPATQAPAKPLAVASESVSAKASLDDKEEVVAPSTAASSPAPAEAAVVAAAPVLVPQPKAEMAPSMKPVKPEAAPRKADAAPTKPVDKKPADKKPVETHAKADVKNDAKTDKSAAKSKADGNKARALLDGKAAPAERTVIQAGAFADADKVREVRHKLEQAGLTTYTQVIDGKDGKRTTRVRLGPYESREEAEKAAARIRKLGLSPSLSKI